MAISFISSSTLLLHDMIMVVLVEKKRGIKFPSRVEQATDII
jgi:hypothetical protein